MKNPFDEDVDDIASPVYVRMARTDEPEVFFEGDRFLEFIQDAFDSFDVVTYSNSRSDVAPLRRINRLITNLPIPARSGLRPKQVRVVINNHAKVFYCYDKEGVLQAVYVGSQNLSHGTQINIMVRLDYRLNKLFLTFFERLWKQAKQI